MNMVALPRLRRTESLRPTSICETIVARRRGLSSIGQGYVCIVSISGNLPKKPGYFRQVNSPGPIAPPLVDSRRQRVPYRRPNPGS